MVDESPKLFSIKRRFLRSTQLERDWQDPDALQDYVLTEQATESLSQFANSLKPASTLRAWRITGDYGSGKSSFGLLLARLLYSGIEELPDSFETYFEPHSNLLAFREPPRIFPILITGARESLGVAILNGLIESFSDIKEPVITNLLEEWTYALQENKVYDSQVLDWLKKVHKYLVKTGQANGTLLLLDEVGKFLEFAAMHPDRQDIYLLQSIAEFATRSGSHPFYITALLHQGISAYAERLPVVQQKEWEKIAGRFEEIIWHQPSDQVTQLIATALNLRVNAVDYQLRRKAIEDMVATVAIHWYGAAAAESVLISLAERLFPLHPTVIPPLIRFFANFGQNERSLFAFLLGSEPFGLQDFVERTNGHQFYCLHNFYDYVRNVLGTRIQVNNYKTQWKAIETIVGRYNGSRDHLSHLIKTVALLNVLDADDLLPTTELLQLALPNEAEVLEKLNELQTAHHLYYRGRAGGFSVWPHTSINLQSSYEKAQQAIPTVRNVSTSIAKWLDDRHLIARRHYIQTGTLRYFDIRYCNVADVNTNAEANFEADGRIVIPLCETLTDRQSAIKIAEESSKKELQNVLIAIPVPLEGLSPLITEYQRWEWIERNTPGLEYDDFAKEEVSRKITSWQNELQYQVQRTVGIVASSEIEGVMWYWKGLPQNCPDIRNVMGLLTTVFNEVYHQAPQVFNELINRRLLSSAASAARLRLIDLLFRSPSQPYIGLNSEKTPPEMSMYLSVIRSTNLHRLIDDIWTIALPEATDDPNKLLPIFNKIKQYLEDKADERVSISDLNFELQKAPYGVRDGLFYLLLAIYTVVYENELAYYEDGTFIPRVTGNIFQRITKAPESFEIQYFPLNHVRSGLFSELVDKLNLGKAGAHRVDLLDVVKPLASFAAALPVYTKQTKRLSPQAITVRDILKTARDPAGMLFNDLPKACGLRKIDKRESHYEDVVGPFVETLQNTVDEIRGAYPNLLQHILARLFIEFQLDKKFEVNRITLSERASILAKYVTETRLKSFCLRIADDNLSEAKWAESLGSLVCSSTPTAWRDTDVHKYEQEIHSLSSQFLRVEAIAFQSRLTDISRESFRVSLTRASGEEQDRVIYLSQEDESRAMALKKTIVNLISGSNQIGMVAMTQALWDIIEGNKSNQTDLAD